MSWHEQMVTVPIGDGRVTLEGVWQSGSLRGAVIAPPHPEYGGSMDSPVCNELAYGLYKSGIASLRFNWKGVGASQGVRSGDLEAAEEDYAAALEHTAQSAELPLIAAGYSFGSVIALRCAMGDPRVRDVLMVAPPVAMLEALPLDQFGRPLHVIVGGQDTLAPVDKLSALISPLPNANLDVIPKADHFFASGGLAELPQLVQSAINA